MNVEQRLHDRKELWLRYLIYKISQGAFTLRENEYTNFERLAEGSWIFFTLMTKEAHAFFNGKTFLVSSCERPIVKVNQGFGVYSILGYLISGIKYFMRKCGYKKIEIRIHIYQCSPKKSNVTLK